ncbi:MAG: hypothetical protein ABFD81_18415 [Syntrophaceae bacterium]
MKKVFVAFSILVWSVLMNPCMVRAGENWTWNVNVTLGAKYFDNVVWDTAGGLETGIDFDLKHKSWPVSLSVGVSGAFSLDVSTTELRLGARKIYDATPRMHPFVGGGVDFVDAEEEELFDFDDQDPDTDTGVGPWISAGIYWTFADWFNVGFDLGYSYVPVTIADKTANAGGFHLQVLCGYHW